MVSTRDARLPTVGARKTRDARATRARDARAARARRV